MAAVRVPPPALMGSQATPGGRGTGQHAVLGGDPAAALAAQELRDPVLDADGAEDRRAPQLDERRAVSVREVAAGDAQRPHLVVAASVRAQKGGSVHEASCGW